MIIEHIPLDIKFLHLKHITWLYWSHDHDHGQHNTKNTIIDIIYTISTSPGEKNTSVTMSTIFLSYFSSTYCHNRNCMYYHVVITICCAASSWAVKPQLRWAPVATGPNDSVHCSPSARGFTKKGYFWACALWLKTACFAGCYLSWRQRS